MSIDMNQYLGAYLDEATDNLQQLNDLIMEMGRYSGIEASQVQ